MQERCREKGWRGRSEEEEAEEAMGKEKKRRERQGGEGVQGRGKVVGLLAWRIVALLSSTQIFRHPAARPQRCLFVTFSFLREVLYQK